MRAPLRGWCLIACEGSPPLIGMPSIALALTAEGRVCVCACDDVMCACVLYRTIIVSHTLIHLYTHTPIHPYTHNLTRPYNHTHIHSYTGTSGQSNHSSGTGPTTHGSGVGVIGLSHRKKNVAHLDGESKLPWGGAQGGDMHHKDHIGNGGGYQGPHTPHPNLVRHQSLRQVPLGMHPGGHGE